MGIGGTGATCDDPADHILGSYVVCLVSHSLRCIHTHLRCKVTQRKIHKPLNLHKILSVCFLRVERCESYPLCDFTEYRRQGGVTGLLPLGHSWLDRYNIFPGVGLCHTKTRVHFSMSAVSRTTSLVLLLSLTLIGPSLELLAASQSRPASTDNNGISGKASVGKDSDFLKIVEAGLFNNLGLKSRPNPQRKSGIPDYMLELYELYSSRSGSASPFLKTKGRGLTSANTVRSFLHTDVEQTDAGCDEKNCVRMWFNISTIPDGEALAAAELRVFKDVYKLLEANKNNSAVKHAKTSQRHRVEVHEIMQPLGQSTECISRLIDTKVVDLKNSSAWESFDVHSAVLKWKKRPRLNHGLEVRLITNNPSVTTDTHVRLRRSASMSDTHWHTQRPLLVTYTDDGRGPKPRTRRASNRARRRKQRKKKRRRRKHKNQCRRHALYVDFNDVGWNDWIVAPSGYNAFYCHGDCPFPLAHHLNSTNHAIVQTLVNSVNPSAVPKACCVPTELTAISMLYLDEWDKVVLKNYQDMVVEACGCR